MGIPIQGTLSELLSQGTVNIYVGLQIRLVLNILMILNVLTEVCLLNIRNKNMILTLMFVIGFLMVLIDIEVYYESL